MRLNRITAAYVCAAALSLSALVQAAPPTSKPIIPQPLTTTERQALATSLASNDAAVRKAALDTLFDRMKATPYGRDRAELLSVVVDAKRYADADDLALKMIFFAPANVATLGRMQELRANSFLASGEPAKALSAAKSYYAVCEMKETQSAIALVGECLAQVHPDDVNIVDRLRAQQTAWSASGITPPEKDGPLGAPILAAAPLEETKIAALLKDLENTVPEGHKGLTARGNLYLLTGRADEAKVVFDMALEASKDKKQRDIAAEGVARSLRAKYWSLGEATRYLATSAPSTP